MGENFDDSTAPLPGGATAPESNAPAPSNGDSDDVEATPPGDDDGSGPFVDEEPEDPTSDGGAGDDTTPVGSAPVEPSEPIAPPPVLDDGGVEPMPVGDAGGTPPSIDDAVVALEPPRACADLYAQDLLPRFEVEMDEAEWEGLQSDCDAKVEEYRPIVFRYGEESQPAMIRLKGNWSWDCAKMQFVISFNEEDSDGRFHGLRKIVLDAPWYDATLLHERLAFDYLSSYGGPSSCVNNAELFVNGNYYGAYANVERVDREYLERHFRDPSGNLFKEGRELVTNEDEGSTESIQAFWAVTTVEQLEAAVDLEQAVRVWAAQAMLPDPDSYWAGVEINFYLYEPPGRRLVFLPYDADLSFAENVWPELAQMDPITQSHPEWYKEAQFRVALDDVRWCESFVEALRAARAAFDVRGFEEKVDRWSAQISDAVADDPNRTFALEEHAAALEALRSFPSRRAAFVDEWLGGTQCPVVWP